MIRLGIIGSIGSGKSFVSKLFKYPVFNADDEVKYLYKNNKKCFRKLKKKLPKFISSFPIKKKELINAINSDSKNLGRISSVIHPMVRKRMNVFLKKNNKSEVVVLDIPLLIENKLYKNDDILIFIASHKKKIIKRLKKRSNYNKNILKKLMENQHNLSKKKKLANYIVENNYPINIMKAKIKQLKKKIFNERNST